MKRRYSQLSEHDTARAHRPPPGHGSQMSYPFRRSSADLSGRSVRLIPFFLPFSYFPVFDTLNAVCELRAGWWKGYPLYAFLFTRMMYRPQWDMPPSPPPPLGVIRLSNLGLIIMLVLMSVLFTNQLVVLLHKSLPSMYDKLKLKWILIIESIIIVGFHQNACNIGIISDSMYTLQNIRSDKRVEMQFGIYHTYGRSWSCLNNSLESSHYTCKQHGIWTVKFHIELNGINDLMIWIQ